MDDKELNKIVREAYPRLEVSSDLRLRLWNRLENHPKHSLWWIPLPVTGGAVLAGLLAGLMLWGQINPMQTLAFQGRMFSQVERLDLFGNAPVGSLAGSYLRILQEEI